MDSGSRQGKQEQIDPGKKKCPSCGAAISRDAKICPTCGSELTSKQSVLKFGKYTRPATKKGKVIEIVGFAAVGVALLLSVTSRSLNARLEVCRGPLAFLGIMAVVLAAIQLARLLREAGRHGKE